ncbi:TetR/AcrR family transcriptional regulator [Oceanobacillus sp. CAU 1775]
MEKSLELFAKNGFNATSIQEITDQCGISKGAFYLSFKSKDALILSLVEYFLKEVTAEIDQLVSESKKEELPYNYFYYHFENLSEKSNFTKVFMKEQTHFLDNELLTKIHGYADLIQQSILTMLRKTYGDKIKHMEHDMVYTVQGLIKSYTEVFLLENIHLDVARLATSLTEKTDLLATYTKKPYIPEEIHNHLDLMQKQGAFSQEQLLEILDEALEDIEPSIVKDSLVLLKEDLLQPSMSPAVIQGLIMNIKDHPNCKWAGFALKNYYQEQ